MKYKLALSSCKFFLFQQRHFHRGFFKGVIENLRFHLINKQELQRNACILYSNLEQTTDLNKFFKVCHLPDTFYSWVLITELHVWMLCVRLMSEPERNNICLRDALLQSFWSDINDRSTKLEEVSSSKRKEQVRLIYARFIPAFFSYDESLNGDDKVLASALWRTLYDKRENNLESIECCVNYIRKNIALLDSKSLHELMYKKFSFSPLLPSHSPLLDHSIIASPVNAYVA